MTQQKPAPPPTFGPGIGFAVKPGLDSKNDLKDPKKGGRQHRRNLASPCDRPPATPTGVRMHFRAIEAKTHLNFKGRITWNEVTEDTSGFPINTVDRWDVQWRAVDDASDPIEVEHSALRRAWTVGDTFWFRTTRDISPATPSGEEWDVGDRVKIRGCFPQTNYNGTFTITDIPFADQFTVDGIEFESDAQRVGEVYNLSTDQLYRRKMRNPQPKIALRAAQQLVRTTDHHNVTSTTNASGTTYRINTAASNTWDVGDYVKIENVSPPHYNGVWRVTNRIDSDTFEVDGDTNIAGPGGSGDAYTATTIYRYTTRGESGFNAGQRVRITGCRPQTEFNGTWTITNINAAEQTFDVEPSKDPDDLVLDAEVLGSAYNETDNLYVLIPHVPRPKTWRWEARVRCRSGEGCWSAFSEWTDPILPFHGAEPRPPVPDYGLTPIDFDHRGKGHGSKVRLLFTFDEVLDWDVPGGDREEDVAAYVIQLDSSTDGVNWDAAHDGGGALRTHHRKAKDGDADTTVTAVFDQIHRHLWYRCRVRTVDRFHRVGEWSDWTSAALPFDDDAPNPPTTVKRYPAHDRIIIEYDPPTISLPTRGTVSGTSGTSTLTGVDTHFLTEVESGSLISVDNHGYFVETVASATSLEVTGTLSTSPVDEPLYVIEDDPDIAFYERQIAFGTDVDTGETPDKWSDIYRVSRGQNDQHAFRIQNDDEEKNFQVRVRSVDAARNRSPWISGTSAGNDDPNVSGENVSLIRDVIQVDWQDGGDAATGVMNGMWRADRDYRIKRMRATCGNHNAASHPADGTPGGQALKLNVVRITDLGGGGETVTPIVDNDDKLSIAPGDHGDTVNPGTDDFNINTVSEGDYLYATISQIGTTRAGRFLRVVVTLVPLQY